MKLLTALLLLVTLSGCAGLNVQWVVTATYNTPPTTTTTTLTPGVPAAVSAALMAPPAKTAP